MINRKINLLWSCLFLHMPALAETFYAYSQLDSEKAAILIFHDGGRIAIGDEILEAKDCSTKEMNCLTAEGVVIALPVERVSSMGKYASIRVFGSELEVRATSYSVNSIKYNYWYSKKRGLVAFQICNDVSCADYYLNQKDGFKFK